MGILNLNVCLIIGPDTFLFKGVVFICFLTKTFIFILFLKFVSYCLLGIYKCMYYNRY